MSSGSSQQFTAGPIADDFFRMLCQHAAVALLATDDRYNIVCWNPAAEAMLGSPASRMLGKPISSIAPENRRRLFDRLLRRTVQRKETTQFTLRLPDAAGQLRHLIVLLTPIFSPQGESRGVAGWIVDETHHKRLGDRLSQAEKMASLGTLAGGVAHHFNNILGGVATFVDFALSSGDVTSMRRALQMTAEAAARASKITQSLLSFAAKDTPRHDMADLTEVVLTFAHLVERPLAERNIRLHLDLHPVPIVAVEAGRMHQVLGNLLTNAEEAMPQGGLITLKMNRTDSDVLLSFADTGCGIEPRHLPLVFEPFFTTKGLLAGGDKANPGLGLSVVHGIITDMGGRIDVRSELNKWTEFVISLPVER